MLKVIVSACLLGAPVRFDGRDKLADHPVLQKWLEEGRVVSACPEMLGGLGTPRPPAEIVERDGVRRVVTPNGTDVSAAFEAGAQTVADQALAGAVRVAVLKEGSPSCGSSYVYDGTFSKVRKTGEGVATALLREHGIAVFSENEFDAAGAYLASLEEAQRRSV